MWTKEAMRAAGGSGMALMDNKANLVAFEGEPWVRLFFSPSSPKPSFEHTHHPSDSYAAVSFPRTPTQAR